MACPTRHPNHVMRHLSAILLALAAAALPGQGLPVVEGVPGQPLLAGALRVAEALTSLGAPLGPETTARIAACRDAEVGPELVRELQSALDPYCLAMVEISPESRVRVDPGPAPAELLEGGWRTFLVKVHNLAASRAPLFVRSPNAAPVLHVSTNQPEPAEKNAITPGQLAQRFLEAKLYQRRPMAATLSGLRLEYVILQLYTRERGPHEARLAFDIGLGSSDLGFRNAIDVLFHCAPAVKVVLRVADFDGEPTMAAFTITDGIERLEETPRLRDYRLQMARREPWDRSYRAKLDRLVGIYPLPSRRVASRDEYPDFFFQPQVYRADGEHVYLPPGDYDVSWTRGPEYLPGHRRITVPAGVETHEERFELQRWTHLAALGWYSADHHVHGGGCAHYESPAAGVTPQAMMRQALGEDLNISCVLTWGPCWYHQKTFFEGKVSELSTPDNLMRYDVEVSGFPSSHAGHLCLLRLREDDYPGTETIEEWPSWTLPVLQWGKEQGGVVGYAHSGYGLEPRDGSDKLPSLSPPRFDGIGANEYIVTWVHGACDFISAGDTPAPWELTIWYHTLNCGARTRIGGETDFPCIFDERIGMARSYAKLEGGLDFDEFTEQLRAGRIYVSDGRSHILDFAVDDAAMGVDGSELELDAPATVKITAKVTALLAPERDEVGRTIVENGVFGQPYWHVEKARIGKTRRVPVELVVNGEAVAKKEIEADGSWHDVAFEHPIDHSSWVALRIYLTSHTNPIFVLVDDKPIRASRASAAWCLQGVDQCWKMKAPRIRETERAAAQAAYDVARRYYRQVATEAVR